MFHDILPLIQVFLLTLTLYHYQYSRNRNRKKRIKNKTFFLYKKSPCSNRQKRSPHGDYLSFKSLSYSLKVNFKKNIAIYLIIESDAINMGVVKKKMRLN